MNPNQWPGCASRLLVIALATLILSASASAEWKEKVLYSFQGGSAGSTPAGGVVFDRPEISPARIAGVASGCPSNGCGTVFEISPPTQKGDA